MSLFSYNLQNRLGYVKKIGRNFQTEQLKHKDVVVSLATGGSATVVVFNLEAMIMSLLLDKSIRHPDIFALGYNLLTGKSICPNDHTGDAWEPARKYFCRDYTPNQHMPHALVYFWQRVPFRLERILEDTANYVHTVLQPDSKESRRNWHPISCIPNLGYRMLTKKE